MTGSEGHHEKAFRRPAPKKETSAMRRWLDRLKGVGLAEARDDLLVAAGFVYGVGYMVWAFHASRHNLGLLPALESQYFIAGVVPALFVVAVYKLTTLLEPALDRLRTRLGSPKRRWERWLRKVINFCFVGGLALVVLSALAEGAFPQFHERAMPIFVAMFVVGFLFLPDWSIGEYSSGRSPRIDRWVDRFFQGYRTFMVRYPAVGIVFVGIIFYGEKVHPILPQEFGGGRPRCASLDLTKAELSSQSLTSMLSQDATIPDGQVVRSIDVDVFFAGGDYLLVKPRDRPESDDTTYEIRRSAAQAIAWCK